MEYESSGIANQLADHITKNITKGYTMDSLKYSLMNQGYSRISVENAIDLANRKLAEKIPPIKEKPKITYKIVSEDVIQLPIKVIKQKKSFWKMLFGS